MHRASLAAAILLLCIDIAWLRLYMPNGGDELTKSNGFTESEITILLSGGQVYKIKQNITLPSPSVVTIVGEGSTIQCIGEAGLIFHNKTMINISNITISGCGTINAHFKVAVYIESSNKLIMNSVAIENSSGTGLALVNCRGTICINNSEFKNNSQKTDSPIPGGGGITIQQMDVEHNLSIEITQCQFISNQASTGDYKLEDFPIHAGFLVGRGGGLSVNLNTSFVNLSVSECYFENNIAHRGGGMFVIFLNNSTSNEVNITKSNFTANQCTIQKIPESIYSSGGGLAILYQSQENTCIVGSCSFSNNTAYYGGGLSVGTKRGNKSSAFTIEESHFESNSAQIGSAIDIFCFSIEEGINQQCMLTPKIKNTDLTSNDPFYVYSGHKKTRTFATLHLQNLAAEFEGNIDIARNQASGIGLETARMDICAHATISITDNSGINGGGIVGLGDSEIVLNENTTLVLTANVATERGGGIYFEQPNRFFSIYSYTCFMRYVKPGKPDVWNVNVTFANNTANGKPNAIFTSSIYPCVWPSEENLSTQLSNTFCRWKTFHFGTSCTSLIKTLPQNFTQQEYSVKLYPNVRKKIDNFGVFDDLNHDVTNSSLFTTCILSNNACSHEEEPDFNTETGLLVHSRHGAYKVLVQTAYHRSVSAIVSVEVEVCPAGHSINSGGCSCNLAASVQSVLQCSTNFTMTVFIGHCAGYVDNTTMGNITNNTQQLLYSKCPFTADRKYLKPTVRLNSTPDEYNEEFCKQYNRSGFLCHSCKPGLGIDVFSPYYKCVPCNETQMYVNWFKAIGAVIGPQTLFFIIVVIFHIGITAPSMIGYIFFSHVVTLPLEVIVTKSAWALDKHCHPSVPTDILMDPYRIWSFDYPEIFHVTACLDGSWRIMHAIAFRYLHALYPILLLAATLLFIELHARNCKPVVYMWKPLCFLCVRFRRKWEIKTSVIDAFATVILLSYSKIINTSLYLLTRNYVKDVNGTILQTRLDFDTSVVYFEGDHIVFASVAIFMLSTFGLIPPLLLILYPNRLFFKFLSKIKLGRWQGLHMFVETFQGSFKNRTNGSPERRWFAGVYFVFRIIVFIVFAVVEEVVRVHLYLAFTYTAFLIVIVFLRPYKKNFYTYLDASFMAILIITNCSIVYCITKVQQQQGLPNFIWKMTYTIQLIPTAYLALYIVFLLCSRSRSRFIQRYCVSNVRRIRDTAVAQFTNTNREQVSEELLTSNDYIRYKHINDLPTHSSLNSFSEVPDRVDNPQRYCGDMDWGKQLESASSSVVSVDREKDRKELLSKD